MKSYILPSYSKSIPCPFGCSLNTVETVLEPLITFTSSFSFSIVFFVHFLWLARAVSPTSPVNACSASIVANRINEQLRSIRCDFSSRPLVVCRYVRLHVVSIGSPMIESTRYKMYPQKDGLKFGIRSLHSKNEA